MIGTINPNIREVTVIGGGISGLIAAYFLDQRGYDVTLIEAENRTGGMIRTTQTSHGMVESAAHSIQVTPVVAQFFNELDVKLTPVRLQSGARYVLRKGQLRRFPLSPVETAKAVARALSRIRINMDSPNPNLRDWTLHYFGPQALEYMIHPMVTGIYGALPEELSVRAAFPRFALMSRLTPDSATGVSTKRPPRAWRKKNKPQMMAPLYGMSSLVEALTQRLEMRLKEKIQRNRKITELPQSGNTVLATPASVAAQLLQTAHPDLASALTQIEYAPLVTVTAFIPKTALKREPVGVGVLFPPSEGRSALGILFNSSSFEGRVRLPETTMSLTFLFAGSRNPTALHWNESELRRAIFEDLGAIYGLQENPKITHLEITRWPLAIPKYGQALQHVWEVARTSWCAQPGNVLFGNYAGQISIRGMIESADVAFQSP